MTYSASFSSPALRSAGLLNLMTWLESLVSAQPLLAIHGFFVLVIMDCRNSVASSPSETQNKLPLKPFLSPDINSAWVWFVYLGDQLLHDALIAPICAPIYAIVSKFPIRNSSGFGIPFVSSVLRFDRGASLSRIDCGVMVLDSIKKSSLTPFAPSIYILVSSILSTTLG